MPESHADGYILLMHDITTLRDLSRFKDEMLRVVSHDLRSPVALIISAHEMLSFDLTDLDADSLVPRYLEIIQQSTERMSGLLDDLLRADPSSKERIDGEILIRRVVERVWPMAEQKRQTLDTRFALRRPGGSAGRPDAAGRGGRKLPDQRHQVHARWRRPSACDAYVEDQRLYYLVEDNGPGIAPEYQDQLFEAYFRSPDSASAKQKGYGIGLSLVKSIVSRHGGEVWMESSGAKGSRFGLWLPLI